MNEFFEYTERDMAVYLFPFYAMLDFDGIELTCEKVESELKEWLNAKIEALKCCGNCKFTLIGQYNFDCIVDALNADKTITKARIKPKLPRNKCDRWESMHDRK